MENVTTSHNLESNGAFKNKAYPVELQPRDRERATMQNCLILMANNLAPEDLMESRNLNQGAPIIRNDGVVLNGNGRTATIKFAYENGKAENYRQSILENAEKFGINRDAVTQMKNPVLVREIVGELLSAYLQAITEFETVGVKRTQQKTAKLAACFSR